MVTRDESITKLLDPDIAALGRDALAKIVYSKLFDWFVHGYEISHPFAEDCLYCLDAHSPSFLSSRDHVVDDPRIFSNTAPMFYINGVPSLLYGRSSPGWPNLI